jgi:predicted DCC family thiol-disulfide oxidoreductase YuxK
MKESIVLFDGVCCLCNNVVRFIGNRDRQRRFWFASLQSPAGQAFLRMLNLPEYTLDTFYLIQNGRVYKRSDAALRIAGQLSFPWPVLYGLMLVPLFIRDFLYNLVARHRYTLFRKVDILYAD